MFAKAPTVRIFILFGLILPNRYDVPLGPTLQYLYIFTYMESRNEFEIYCK